MYIDINEHKKRESPFGGPVPGMVCVFYPGKEYEVTRTVITLGGTNMVWFDDHGWLTKEDFFNGYYNGDIKILE